MAKSKDNQEKDFCKNCMSGSTDQSPGDVSTVNGVGRKFYGKADICPECGSMVKTLWWCLVDLPVIPLGSYRYLSLEPHEIVSWEFKARKTATNWAQVFKTWAIGIVIGIIVVTAIAIYDSSRR